MAQCGNITFFTPDLTLDVSRLLRGSFDAAGTQAAAIVSRSIGEDRRWDELRRLQEEGVPEDAACYPSEGAIIYEEADASECLGQQLPVADVPALYREGTSLRVILGDTRLGLMLWDVLGAVVPNAIRGEFVPVSPTVVVGGHDIYESAEHDEGFLFGRAFYSFSLFGYGAPNDWKRYRELIFDVPAIGLLQDQLEAFAGPLQRCVYWNV